MAKSFTMSASEQSKCVPSSLIGVKSNVEKQLSLLNPTQLTNLKGAIQKLLPLVTSQISTMSKQVVAISISVSKILSKKLDAENDTDDISESTMNTIKNQTDITNKYSSSDITKFASNLNLSPKQLTNDLKESQQAFDDTFSGVKSAQKSVNSGSNFIQKYSKLAVRQQEMMGSKLDALKSTQQKLSLMSDTIDERLNNV